MTITATSLPIRAYGYPPVEWDSLIERWNVKPPDSLVEPVGGWGTLRVEIGAVWQLVFDEGESNWIATKTSPGVDFTVYRGCPTQLDDLRWGEPYGEIDGSLRVPALTIFDDLTDFHLAAVDVYRVLPPILAATLGRIEVPYWHGFISAIETAHGPGQEPGVTLALQGAMFGEISLRAHQPIMVNDSQDVGTWLGRALDPQAYSRPLAPFHFQFDAAETGIDLRHQGSRGQMVVDYCDEVLALAQEGSSQWTISRQYDEDGFPIARAYYLREKSNELAGAIQQNYVVLGGFGVSASLSVDPTEVPTTVYGEGLAPGDDPWRYGQRWRNAVFPMLTETAPAYPDRISGSDYPVTLGDSNADFTAPVITQLQGQLRAAGWPDVTITGTFDVNTATALIALQEDQGVTVTGEITSDAGWDLVWSTGTGYTDLASGWYKPLASLPEVEKYIYAADGDVLDDNPDYDPAALRVDRAISFGDGIAKSRGRKYSKRLVSQASDHLPVVGTVTLTSDPTNEGADARGRGDIHEGSWIRLGNAASPAGQYRDLYVAGVQFSPQGYAAPVTLTVASKSWDLLDLTTRLEARREAKDDLSKSFYSKLSRPQRVWGDGGGWDAESGAGLIRPFSHPGGEWVVRPFVAGGFAGTIQEFDLQTTVNTEVVFAVFATDVDPGDLAALIPDPLVAEPDGYGWFTHPDTIGPLADWRLVGAWGEPDNPGGYWPGSKPQGLPLTGRTHDDQGWGFYTNRGVSMFLYLAMWCADATDVSGDMRILVNE